MTKLAPNIPKWSQMVLKWPQCRKIDFRDRDWSAIILHLEAKIAPNGPKWSQMIPNCPKWSQIVPNSPKWTQMVPKWPERLQIDFLNHLHWISAPLAAVLSGHMISLRQIGPEWSQNAASVLFWVPWWYNFIWIPALLKSSKCMPRAQFFHIYMWGFQHYNDFSFTPGRVKMCLSNIKVLVQNPFLIKYIWS